MMLVSLGALGTRSGKGHTRVSAPTCLSNLTPAFSKKPISFPPATCIRPKGLNNVAFQQGKCKLSHLLAFSSKLIKPIYNMNVEMVRIAWAKGKFEKINSLLQFKL